MIQSINFMGREECLTGPVKKVQKNVTSYVADSAILPELKKKAPIMTEDANYVTKLNEAYKAAHAPYLEKPVKTESQIVMDGQIL